MTFSPDDSVPPLAADHPASRYPAIQDYAVIGDCRSAALVSKSGSIEWLCWPRFDSPSIFAAVLDRERGGHWMIAPTGPCRVERQYEGDSNVLRTTFVGAGGTVAVIDLMPVASEAYKRRTLLPDHELVRQVECTHGEVELLFDFLPRAQYGRYPVQMSAAGGLGVRMAVDRGVYWLRSSYALVAGGERIRTTFRLRARETAQFSLTYGEDAPMVLPPLGEWTADRIRRSVEWWHAWAHRAKYDGPYRDEVIRSALALKLMTYAPSGAVIAAPTTSLPERIGSGLNWDYRYCWLRDASLSVRSLLGLGYWEEADAFLNWMLHATALTRPELRILYDVFGGNAPREFELQWLEGYRRSQPVRVGNAARDQLQLDVYGEVVDAAAQYAHHGGTFDRSTQKVLKGIGNYVAAHWSEPDEGIWEPRGGREPHTHSRLLCWTALDRLLRLEQQGKLQGIPAQRYQTERQRIYEGLKQSAWNERLETYTAVPGRENLDASLLLMSWYGFEAAGSERMRKTYAAIRRRLGARNELLYRYVTEPPEGAFGICSFWEAEYLAHGGGTLEEARCVFEQLCKFCNDLGLFAEEIDPHTGDALGNFPQAFTHVGLISAALSLQERGEGRQHLPHRAPSAEHAHQETAA